MTHHHVHKPVAETKTHAYFECTCGHRAVGRRQATRGAYPEPDAEWLAGAERKPR